jgi:hypothetical protein
MHADRSIESTPGDDRDAAFAGVATLLWSEREVLENLLHRLVAQQLILRAGQLRWLANADGDVRTALERVHEYDLLRALEVADLTERLAVPEQTSLRELAQLAPRPWKDLLTDHRTALRALQAEITATTAENRRLLQAGADAAYETLSGVGDAPATYRPDGRPAGLAAGPVLLDRQA